MRSSGTWFSAIDAKIAMIRTELECEQAKIADLIATKATGQSPGYWKRRHLLEKRLKTALILREAIEEVLLELDEGKSDG